MTQTRNSPKKPSPQTLAWEASVGWDHPLVKAGIVPEHLIRDFFGWSRTKTWQWCRDNADIVHRNNRRSWIWIDDLIDWFRANVGVGSDCPDLTQLEHNRKAD